MNIISTSVGVFIAAALLCGVEMTGAQSARAADSTSPEVPVPVSIISDNNGNGVIEIMAFGDSITRGKGDFIGVGEDIEVAPELPGSARESGYPLRVEGYLGVDVRNFGNSGESMIPFGVNRFAWTIPRVRPDIVIITEGSNDARWRRSSATLFYGLQAMINIAKASGVAPVVGTLPRPCCNHSGLAYMTPIYSSNARYLSAVNEIPVVDFEQAFYNTCNGNRECYLLNLPEGLHPNIEGYNVMGEVVAARLLGIDLLSATGAAQFEAALGMPAGSIQTKPTSSTAQQ